MREDIFNSVVRLVAQNNDIPESEINMHSTFEELGMDSLDGLALISDLEAEFNIHIPNSEAMQIRSIGQIVEKLEKILVPQ
jgi:acyl carrier protein